jgi:hypothetical protein
MSTSSRACVAIATILAATTGHTSQAAGSQPRIVEESAQLQSPDAQLPLNGPVAIHGNTLVATSEVRNQLEPHGDEGFRCVAFLFERPSATGAWRYLRTLVDFTRPGDHGFSKLAVDVAADTIAVSAISLAFVFERSAAGWTQTRLADPPQGAASDFGSDIATTSNHVVIGGTSNGRLAAFIYHRDAPGQWTFEGRVLAGIQTIADDDYFGEHVAADAGYVVIGNPTPELEPDPSLSGKLYLFRRSNDALWTQVGALYDYLTPSGRNAGSQVSVLATGPGVRAGAFTDGLGGASIFLEDSPDNWRPVDNVRPIDFPFHVDDLELNRVAGAAGLALGMPGDEDRGANSGSVSVYVQQPDSEVFSPAVKFLASDARPGLALGGSLSFQGNTLIARGGDRTYVFRMPDDLTQRELQQDDFEGGDTSQWQPSSSSWTVATVRGSRVYRQTSLAGEPRSTRRALDWSNVAIAADVRPLAFNGADRWVGLMARYIDSQNYYYVSLRSSNVLQLRSRVGSTFRTLAAVPLTVTPDRTYRVRLEAIGTWLRVYVDDRLRLQARDSALKHGSVGLKTYLARAEFDNVIVSPNPALTLLADNFEDPRFFEWKTTPSANWSVVAAGANHVLRQAVAAGRTFAIAGVPYDAAQPEAADQIVAARVRALSFSSGSNPWFGLIARYRDNANYTLITVNRNGYITLTKIDSGAVRVFDSALLTVTAGTWYALRLEAVDDRLRVYVNRSLVLEGRDPDVDPASTRGRYGLITAGTAAEFDDVTVTQP